MVRNSRLEQVLPAGWEQALERAAGLVTTAGNLESVGDATSPEAAKWAFGQWELRQRARTKFVQHDRMLFDRDGLEMATHEAVAGYHASLFPTGQKVADLTVGLGADLIALASRGPAVGFELDPVRCALARHNLQIQGMGAELHSADSVATDWDFAYAFADPSRRARGKRTLDPSAFEPAIERIAERFRELSLGVIKLSPMLPDSYLEALGAKLVFVSYGRECREVLAVFGSEAATFDARAAHMVETGETLPAAGPVGDGNMNAEGWLFEADPAAVRSHALGTLAIRYGLHPLGDSNGYLTGADPNAGDSGWLRGFRVLASGRADLKRIKSLLQARNARVEAVKVRGLKEDPIRWQQKLKTAGADPVVLVLYPVGKSIRFAIVTPES